MLALIWILALAAPTTVELANDVYTIPAEPGWHLPIGLKQRPARILAEFDTRSDTKSVRLTLMSREDLKRLREGKLYQVMAAARLARSGTLDYSIRQPGDYALVIDHPLPDPVEVHVRVRLDFSGRRGPDVTLLSPQRQLAVILISFGVFFGVVTFSARRLLRSVRR